MTTFTPEQGRKIAIYSLYESPRPGNMNWIPRHLWDGLSTLALDECIKCRVRVPDQLPAWVSDQEKHLEPLEHFWRQRLKAAYEKWFRRYKALDRPPTVDSTLEDLLPGTAEQDILLQLEAVESIRDRAELTSKQRKALPPEVSPAFQRVQRKKATLHLIDEKAFPSEQRGIDRVLQKLYSMPRWGKECCDSRCWECSYHEGFRRPGNHRPSRLVLDPEMRTIIDAIDNRKASIAESTDRLEKCSHRANRAAVQPGVAA